MIAVGVWCKAPDCVNWRNIAIAPAIRLWVRRQPWKRSPFCGYNSRVRARIVLPVTFIAALLVSARSQTGVSNSVASADGPCRPQIAGHGSGSGPAPHNGIVMNGIDVLEQDGFREIRGSNPSSPRAVGVITNQTGFDVEGRRTIDILAKAPGIKLVAIFSPEHGVTGELDINSVGDSVDRAT